MNIRFMAQSQLMQEGFRVSNRRAYDWTANLNNRAGNQGQQNNTSASSDTIAAGNNIQNALDNLQGRNNATQSLEGRTSDAEVATVRVDNSRILASAPPQDMRIDVQQLATNQINQGEALNHNHRATGTGSFAFEIEGSDGRRHTFNIAIAASDNNEDIQRRMAAAVNARSQATGVMASVASEGTGDARTTALTFESTLTGTGNNFSVRDVNGDLAATMGVTETSQEAQNAIFTINGGAMRTSQVNDVEPTRGVNITLQGEGTTNITFARNAQATMAAATELVNALNNALGSVNTSAGRGSERFVSDIQGMNRTFASALRNVGIDVQSNGRLTIDQARFQRAAEDGSLGRLFDADSNSGFTARVSRLANNAASGSYRNAPAPVQFQAPNNMFDFGNTGNSSNLMSLFV